MLQELKKEWNDKSVSENDGNGNVTEPTRKFINRKRKVK